MISYADFFRNAGARKRAMDMGLHTYLQVPAKTKIYLDNGAFYFLGRSGDTPKEDYEEFVTHAKPDWWPIPQDFIPTPYMTSDEQEHCFQKTMDMNNAYEHGGFVPVIHICRYLNDYIVAIQASERLSMKQTIAIGGIVPNLLRAPKAMPYDEILTALKAIRHTFANKHVHIFGIGGTATLHIAGLLRIDSADSSGWRNRAARGIVQLAGKGDRVVADLGKWRGRQPNEEEWEMLDSCRCPACQAFGVAGLKADKSFGFSNRATHNLWILLKESHWIEEQLQNETYAKNYQAYLDNTIYLPLIERLVRMPAFPKRIE